MQNKYPFFIKMIRSLKRPILVSSLVLFIQSIIVLVLPLPLKHALDQISKSTSYDNSVDLLIQTILLMLVIGAFASIFEYLEEILNIRLINSFVSASRKLLLQNTLRLEQSYIQSIKKIEIAGRLVGDVQNLETILISGNIVLTRSIPTLLLIFISLLYLKWTFALIVLSFFPIFYLLITFISKKMKFWEKKLRQTQVSFEHELLQTLASSDLVKSLNGEKAALTSLEQIQNKLNFNAEMSKKYFGLFNSSFSMSRHIVRAIVVFLGGYAVLNQQLTLGSLFIFISYLEAMNKPISEISNLISRLSKGLNSLERVEEYHRLSLENFEVGGRDIVSANNLNLQTKNVSFKYNRSVKSLFANLNVSFKKNEFVAIVGSSGSGKSTFIKLLNRLEKPQSGQLILNDKTVADLDIKSVRNTVCVIAQDPFFVSDTVKNNLTLALEITPTISELRSALKKVNADEFVDELPLQLDTLIGESGVQLSGGQSKRLSLARAFLRLNLAQVFVFDEPTSGLDPVSADIVMKSIQELSGQGYLVFYSTHRVKEFSLADKILFFSKNNEPVLATHMDLLKNLEYQQLVSENTLDNQPTQLDENGVRL